MSQRLLVISAIVLLFSAAALADDTFQVRYAANLNIGDSFVDFTNTGATVANGVTQTYLKPYTFEPQEEFDLLLHLRCVAQRAHSRPFGSP